MLSNLKRIEFTIAESLFGQIFPAQRFQIHDELSTLSIFDAEMEFSLYFDLLEQFPYPIEIKCWRMFVIYTIWLQLNVSNGFCSLLIYT